MYYLISFFANSKKILLHFNIQNHQTYRTIVYIYEALHTLDTLSFIFGTIIK